MKGRNQTQMRLEIFENVKIHYGTIQNTADHKDCGDRLVHQATSSGIDFCPTSDLSM